MLRFTVPLYTHKKTQIIAYYADGTQTLAQVCVLYRSYCQTEVSWHRLVRLTTRRSSCGGTKQKCVRRLWNWLHFPVLYSKPSSPSSSAHSKMNPTSPTQTDKHYIHYFRFFECDLICVTHLGRAILLKHYLGRHAVVKRYVRWSLKRAKCTVCLSSNLLRGKPYIHTTHSVVGKDFKKGQ